jgi:nucleotide-binding universal stress UspA family protein
MGLAHTSQTVLIVCVIASGTFFGITNTLMTQVVMESAPVPRPIASSAYSFVRFCGGAIAPFVAGKLAEHVSVQAPFYLGAAMTAIGVLVLWSYRGALGPVQAPAAAGPDAPPAAAGTGAPPAPDGVAAPGPMVVAVAGPTAQQVSALVVPLARARGAAVHVLHVIETDVLAGEAVAELEGPADGRPVLELCMSELREAGVPVTGELLHSYGTHVDVGGQILRRAAELGAGAIVLGPATRPPLSTGVTGYVAGHAPSHVVIVNPRAGALGRPLAVAAAAAAAAAAEDPATPGGGTITGASVIPS